MRKATSYALSAGIGFVVCLAAVALTHGAAPFNIGQSDVLTKLDAPTPTRTRTGDESLISKASAAILPSVVTIDVDGSRAPSYAFPNNPLFRQFFGDPYQSGQSQKTRAVGSGVIISDDGYIITNNHVVTGENGTKIDKVTVVLNDGKAYDAKVIGTDLTSDIAVVKINAVGEKLKSAALGDSSQLQVGDMVIAAGNPLNIGATVTFGIVSALGHRNSDVTGGQIQADNIIQTDAAINHGNSGGPLADMEGRVIGINEAIVSSTNAYAGIGLAIPVNTVKKVATELIKNGRVVRPYIGVQYTNLKEVPQDDRANVGIATQGDNGAVVTQVMPNSPAAKAGLRIYDVILDANGHAITDFNSLKNIIEKLKVGDKLVLRISRNGQVSLITVTLKEMPHDFGQQIQSEDDQNQEQQEQPDNP